MHTSQSESAELRSLAGLVINSFRPAAIKQDSILYNEIPAGIFLTVDKELLASVLGRLLSAVITHSRGCYIRLTAQVLHDVILLHIRDHNSVRSFVVNSRLQSLAQKMKGNVACSDRRESSGIAFSFSNFPAAA